MLISHHFRQHYMLLPRKENLADFVALFQLCFSVLRPKPNYLKDGPPSSRLISHGSGSVLPRPLTSHQPLFKMLHPGGFSGRLGLLVPQHAILCSAAGCEVPSAGGAAPARPPSPRFSPDVITAISSGSGPHLSSPRALPAPCTVCAQLRHGAVPTSVCTSLIGTQVP